MIGVKNPPEVFLFTAPLEVMGDMTWLPLENLVSKNRQLERPRAAAAAAAAAAVVCAALP